MQPGVFLILAAKAPATVWQVHRSANGVIGNLAKKYSYVNHYSFHIMDPQWGHVTIKMSGHPPFAAQVMLNGHEFVACQARAAGIDFRKDGNCFTAVAAPNDLARVADTLSQPGDYRAPEPGLRPVDLHRLPVFRSGQRRGAAQRVRLRLLRLPGRVQPEPAVRRRCQMDRTVRHRGRPHPLPAERDQTLRTMFGAKQRPRQTAPADRPRLAAMIETPVYDLTTFKVHFGRLTLKAYTKGEHVLRFEAIVHNTTELNCGRGLDMFGRSSPDWPAWLERFTPRWTASTSASSPTTPSTSSPPRRRSDATRVGGIDLNRPACAARWPRSSPWQPHPTDSPSPIRRPGPRHDRADPDSGYSTRHASYDLRKIRGKHLVDRPGRTRRYHVPPDAARTIAALLTLRDQVIAPILAGVRSPELGRKPITWTPVDRDYETLRIDLQTLFTHLGITTTSSQQRHRQHFVDRILASGCKRETTVTAQQVFATHSIACNRS